MLPASIGFKIKKGVSSKREDWEAAEEKEEECEVEEEEEVWRITDEYLRIASTLDSGRPLIQIVYVP